MTTTLYAPPPVPDPKLLVYLSRGADLIWRAKRVCDGETVAEDAEKYTAGHKAGQLGFIIL